MTGGGGGGIAHYRSLFFGAKFRSVQFSGSTLLHVHRDVHLDFDTAPEL